ncbi:MAG: aromatic ring-hydroxylating dioxygenase subunit alpha [Pseudomonadota bacterium]
MNHLVTPDRLVELIDRSTPDHSLAQAFYCDPAIYQRDLERIFMTSWLYAGHISEVPSPGSYFLFHVGEESVIVVRGRDGEIRALVNVCRHRGSRVCVEQQGTAKRFMCPYHAWTYDLDGRLVAARLMPEGFDKAGHGLSQLQVRVFEGFIFVSFAEAPADFTAMAQDLAPRLKPYGFDQAKVVFRELFKIQANWKLMTENYLECYHCSPAHPEFALSHSIKLPKEKIAELEAAMMARAKACGLDAPFISLVGNDDPSGVQYHYDRYALLDGYVSGSPDGQPLAPLMGDITGFDGGATNIQIGPVSFFLAYNDHLVVYRFLPRGPQETDAEVFWLVRGDAVEGEDFDREKLTWLWQVTSEADKLIVERNQEGVNSRFYRPGPYSPMEDFAVRFLEWYLKVIS